MLNSGGSRAGQGFPWGVPGLPLRPFFILPSPAIGLDGAVSPEEGGKDENGNPLELGTAGRTKSGSCAGRSFHTGSADGFTGHSSTSLEYGNRGTSAFPNSLSGLDRYHLPVITSSNSDDMAPAASGGGGSSNSASGSDSYSAKSKRRQAKKERIQEKVIKSESIPGHRGEQNVEDLLIFISGNNPNSVHKHRNNSTSNTNGPTSPDTMGQSMPLLNSTKEPLSTKAETVATTETQSTATEQPQQVQRRKKKKNKSGQKEDGGRSGSDNGDDRSSRNGEGRSSLSEGSTVSADTLKDVSNMAAMAARETNNMDSNHGDSPSPLVTPNNYIFTDFQEATAKKAEPDFVEVKHKKKRGTNKAVNGKEIFSSSGGWSATSDLRYQDYTAPRRRSRPPMVSSSRGATPPVEPVIPQERSRATSTERSFSPSGFPVLGRGRRNSTGSAPSEMVNVEGDVDSSDLESVQSVPSTKLAVGGANQKGAPPTTSTAMSSASSSNTLDTNPPPAPPPAQQQAPPTISYASIAAGGLKATKLPSMDVAGSERAVSPGRERRHSVGSLPTAQQHGLTQTLAEQTSSETARSQEFPAITPTQRQQQAADNSPHVSSDTSHSHSQQSTQGPSVADIITPPSAQPTESHTPTNNISSGEAVSNINTDAKSPDACQSVSDTCVTPASDSSVAQSRATMASHSVDSVLNTSTELLQVPPTSVSLTDHSLEGSTHTRVPPGVKPPKAPTRVPARARQPNKPQSNKSSVIFLDTRRGNNVQPTRNNLGLSFGFEPDMDNNLEGIENTSNANHFVLTENLANNKLNVSPTSNSLSYSGERIETNPRNNSHLDTATMTVSSSGNELSFLQESAGLDPHHGTTPPAPVINQPTSQHLVNNNNNTSSSSTPSSSGSSNQQDNMAGGVSKVKLTRPPPNGIVIPPTQQSHPPPPARAREEGYPVVSPQGPVPSSSSTVASSTQSSPPAVHSLLTPTTDSAPQARPTTGDNSSSTASDNSTTPHTSTSHQQPAPPSEPSGNKLLAAIMATGRQHHIANDPNFDRGQFDLQGAQVWLYSCYQDVLAENAEWPQKVVFYAA